MIMMIMIMIIFYIVTIVREIANNVWMGKRSKNGEMNLVVEENCS